MTDDVDTAILECLLVDGRAALADVGRRVGLSVSATKRRVDRLVASGVIQGFTVVVDPNVVGRVLEAQIELFTDGTVSAVRARQDLTALPEIVEATSVTGAADTIVRATARDAAHLESVIARLRSLPYVRHTVTILILTRLVHRPGGWAAGQGAAN